MSDHYGERSPLLQNGRGEDPEHREVRQATSDHANCVTEIRTADKVL